VVEWAERKQEQDREQWKLE
jgi:hypothetical protein